MDSLRKLCADAVSKLQAAQAEEKRLAEFMLPLTLARNVSHDNAVRALAEIIVSAIERHGEFSEYRGAFYRSMSCYGRWGSSGFIEIIEREIGHFEWSSMYLEALNQLDRENKISFFCGMGECDASLREKLTSTDRERILAERERT